MTLLEECIEALPYAHVITGNESDFLFKQFENRLPFTSYGRIDWENLTGFYPIEKKRDILNFVNIEDSCLILWNDMSLPVIRTTIGFLLNSIDDVLAVSYDTWIYIESKETIIEFFHGGKITLTNQL